MQFNTLSLKKTSGESPIRGIPGIHVVFFKLSLFEFIYFYENWDT